MTAGTIGLLMCEVLEEEMAHLLSRNTAVSRISVVASEFSESFRDFVAGSGGRFQVLDNLDAARKASTAPTNILSPPCLRASVLSIIPPMPATLIDGTALAAAIRAQIKGLADDLKRQGRPPAPRRHPRWPHAAGRDVCQASGRSRAAVGIAYDARRSRPSLRRRGLCHRRSAQPRPVGCWHHASPAAAAGRSTPPPWPQDRPRQGCRRRQPRQSRLPARGPPINVPCTALAAVECSPPQAWPFAAPRLSWSAPARSSASPWRCC